MEMGYYGDGDEYVRFFDFSSLGNNIYIFFFEFCFVIFLSSVLGFSLLHT